VTKPIASLSLDLDNKWSYLKTLGDDRWEDYPSYLPTAIPIILDCLRREDLKITFFVVGRDVDREDHADLFRDLAGAGHEIANHSYNHLPWLHLLTPDELDSELSRTEEAVERVCGVSLRGFRGPGFSISEQHLVALVNRGYDFDATAFPNILNPLARAYFFAKSRLSEEEKEQRKALFGNLREARRPIKPFVWNLGKRRLAEIPVTTMPVFRLPIHFSYVIYLAGYSKWLAKRYFSFAMWMCSITGTSPSLLLHPLDFLGCEDETDLSFFPGMNQQRSDKLEILHYCFGVLRKRFDVTTMGEHARQVSRQIDGLRSFTPDFEV